MTDGSGPSALLKVQGSSRLAFGATTAALVTLASGGTAILVAQATDVAVTPTALPPGALPPDLATTGGGLVVDHAAGFVPAPVPVEDPSEKALREALAQRSQPGRRTLTAPLVPVAQPSPVPPVAEVPAATPTEEPTEPPVAHPQPTPPTDGGKGPLGGTGSGTGTDGTGGGDGSAGEPSQGPTATPEKPTTGAHAGHGHGRHHSAPSGSTTEPSRQHDAHHSRGRHARSHGKGRHAR